jgi:serine protease Do
MAGLQNMRQGIQALKDGNIGEGARLLRIALLDTKLSGSMRATTYIWLAETDPNPAFKIQCYNEALAADPGNVHAKQRLDQALTDNLPPVSIHPTQVTTPPPTPPQPQYIPQPEPTPTVQPQRATALFYRTVAVLDGPNGKGTGFFISTDGIFATSRLIISGKENVTVSLDSTRQMIGRVIRSYPELDLAFVQIDLTISHLLPFTSMPSVPENMELTAVVHESDLLRGRVRATKREIKSQWFPTTIRQLGDVGGNPVFDEQNYVVGMLTRNASRSSPDVFGLHIHTILRQLEDYRRDMQQPQRSYCPNCGYISRAESLGAFYCEGCGSVLSKARGLNRFNVPQAALLYGENQQRPCRHCSSRVGFYNGRCLRCGGDV